MLGIEIPEEELNGHRTRPRTARRLAVYALAAASLSIAANRRGLGTGHGIVRTNRSSSHQPSRHEGFDRIRRVQFRPRRLDPPSPRHHCRTRHPGRLRRQRSIMCESGGDHGIVIGQTEHVRFNPANMEPDGTPHGTPHPVMQQTGNQLATTTTEFISIAYFGPSVQVTVSLA
ncbi:hypothetical protein [Nocardia sp. NPDC059239]|uniref:hypothetical protein n=1 Tax=unclassified Nocardia TaxID=2637762 RepID=UPI0036CC0206